MNPSELWWADFPYDDQPKSKKRPVVIVSTDNANAMAVAIKVTSSKPRTNDPYDVAIIDYLQAGLVKPSTARTAQRRQFPAKQLKSYIGTLSQADQLNVMRAYWAWLQKKRTSL